MTEKIDYDNDFYAWAITNAQLLRQQRFTEIDIENIAEELETLGRSEKRELVNRLAVLLAHLLKWQFQPERRGKSWELTIWEQRRKLTKHLRENPSLRGQLEAAIVDAYDDAIAHLNRRTSLEKNRLPNQCPYTLDEIFNEDSLPH
jgi:hypothetical protein